MAELQLLSGGKAEAKLSPSHRLLGRLVGPAGLQLFEMGQLGSLVLEFLLREILLLRASACPGATELPVGKQLLALDLLGPRDGLEDEHLAPPELLLVGDGTQDLQLLPLELPLGGGEAPEDV